MPVVIDVFGKEGNDGEMAYFFNGNWQLLNSGNNGEFLMSRGPGSFPIWSSAGPTPPASSSSSIIPFVSSSSSSSIIPFISSSSSSSIFPFASSSSSSVFSPIIIPSLGAWYDPSDTSTITESLGAVSQLDDKSGNALHLTQATGSAQPTTGTQLINGLNVLDWGVGTNDKSLEYITGASTDNWQDVFVVAVWDGGATFSTFNGLFTGNTSDANNVGILADPSTTNLYDPIRWWNLLNFNGTLIPSPPWTVLPAAQSPSIFEVYANSATTINGIKLGNDRLFPNRGWEGKIGEVLAFTEELSVLNRGFVYNYLYNKWIA